MARNVLISLRTAQVSELLSFELFQHILTMPQLLLTLPVFGLSIILICRANISHRLRVAGALGTTAGAWGIITALVGFLDLFCFHNDKNIGCILLTLFFDGLASGLFFFSGIVS